MEDISDLDKHTYVIPSFQQLSLQRQLEQFARVATMLYQLRSFCKNTSNSLTNPQCSSPFGETEGFSRCQTYEAFANALHHCLEVLVTPLREIEKSIVERSECHMINHMMCINVVMLPFIEKLVTLLSLAAELNCVSKKIYGLHEVFYRGVLQLYEGVEDHLPPTCQVGKHLVCAHSYSLSHTHTHSAPLTCLTHCGLPYNAMIHWVCKEGSCFTFSLDFG